MNCLNRKFSERFLTFTDFFFGTFNHDVVIDLKQKLQNVISIKFQQILKPDKSIVSCVAKE